MGLSKKKNIIMVNYMNILIFVKMLLYVEYMYIK